MDKYWLELMQHISKKLLTHLSLLAVLLKILLKIRQQQMVYQVRQ
jgi:hypothetical protein